MPSSRDFLPLNWAAFAVWFANYVTQLAALKTKYNISEATLEALVQDNAWVQFWAGKRDVAKQQETVRKMLRNPSADPKELDKAMTRLRELNDTQQAVAQAMVISLLDRMSPKERTTASRRCRRKWRRAD